MLWLCRRQPRRPTTEDDDDDDDGNAAATATTTATTTTTTLVGVSNDARACGIVAPARRVNSPMCFLFFVRFTFFLA